MAILLTNGTYYITHNQTGAVVKTDNIEQAQDFHTEERALHQINRAPGKTSGYYVMEIDRSKVMENVTVHKEDNSQVKKMKSKRKIFSFDERKQIYRKTKGHCYLCGEFVDFHDFEIEHRIPLSKGGTNNLSNLYCACHCCNTIKHDIYPEDFMEKITQIFMYQLKKRYWKGHKIVLWKITSKILERMM